MSSVSVIIPVYNSRKYLKKCLDSVCSQSLEDIEIIILDDVSTDGSLDIIRSYEKEDSRIKVISMDKNVGPGALRNIGIREANGDYIGFVDSDDYIESNMYLELYNKMRQNDVDIVTFGYINELYGIDYKRLLLGFKRDSGNERIIVPREEPSFLYDQAVVCWNKLYKHDFIENFSFPEHLKYEDYPMVISMLGSANRIFSMDRSFYHYRLRSNSLTTSDCRKFNLQSLDIFECNRDIKKYYIKSGIFSIYEETLNDIFLVNSLFKLGSMLSITMPLNDKKQLINYYASLIECDFPNWRENEYFQKRRKSSMSLGPYLYLLDKFFLDDNMRDNTDKQKISEKIMELSRKYQ